MAPEKDTESTLEGLLSELVTAEQEIKDRASAVISALTRAGIRSDETTGKALAFIAGVSSERGKVSVESVLANFLIGRRASVDLKDRKLESQVEAALTAMFSALKRDVTRTFNPDGEADKPGIRVPVTGPENTSAPSEDTEQELVDA